MRAIWHICLPSAGVILVVFLLSVSSLQSPACAQYVHDGPIGKSAPAESAAPHLLEDEFPTVDIDDWRGHKIIFLPNPLASKYGYQAFKGGNGPYGAPTVAECRGRIATVVNVEDGTSGDLMTYKVTVRLDGSGKIYTAETQTKGGENATLDDIGFFDDLQRASHKWKGATLWLNTDELSTYDPVTDHVGWVDVKRLSPVKVLDVVASSNDESPIRFIVSTADGAEGFVDVNIGGTNLTPRLRRFSLFTDLFKVVDPRLANHWPDKIWDAIERGDVTAGMTEDQVLFSWYTNESAAATATATGNEVRWTYSDQMYVVFKDGIVTKAFRSTASSPPDATKAPDPAQNKTATDAPDSSVPQTNKPSAPSRDDGDGFASRGISTSAVASGIKVIGEITNSSGKDYEAATFNLSLFNGEGALIEVVPVIMMDFKNGDTKSFETFGKADQPVAKFKLDFDSGY
jgi:hypothetical protein